MHLLGASTPAGPRLPDQKDEGGHRKDANVCKALCKDASLSIPDLQLLMIHQGHAERHVASKGTSPEASLQAMCCLQPFKYFSNCLVAATCLKAVCPADPRTSSSMRHRYEQVLWCSRYVCIVDINVDNIRSCATFSLREETMRLKNRASLAHFGQRSELASQKQRHSF